MLQAMGPMEREGGTWPVPTSVRWLLGCCGLSTGDRGGRTEPRRSRVGSRRCRAAPSP